MSTYDMTAGTSEAEQSAEYRAQGKQAFLRGSKLRDNPYVFNSFAWKWWRRGYFAEIDRLGVCF